MIARGWAALAAFSILFLLIVYLARTGHAATVARAGPAALLDVSGSSPAFPNFAVSVADARRALVSDPLNQQLVNTAMLATARARQEVLDPDWFTVLSRLGWRDTASRQNLLVRHALQRDVSAALDDVDGLLRRNQLIEQITPALLAMEKDPTWQLQVVERLRERPSWRFGFLQRGSLIDDPGSLAARARTIRLLQVSGDDVDAGEIAPVLPKLLGAKLGEEAFSIWQAREPSILRPVADSSFVKLASEREPSTVPFHWQLTNGPDYSVEVGSRPVPHLTLSWNGVGAPVFATQYISVPVGRHTVLLTTPEPDTNVADVIGVRMACGTESVEFDRMRRVSSVSVAYASGRVVPCAFPRLELFGHPRLTGAGSRQAAVSSIVVAATI